MKISVYHVALVQDGNKAVYQYRRNIDYLSCEALEYCGRRLTTKTTARQRLKLEGAETRILAILNTKYPDRKFERVIID